MGYEADSSVMPAFAQRILIGPKTETACSIHSEIEASSDISPETVVKLA